MAQPPTSPNPTIAPTIGLETEDLEMLDGGPKVVVDLAAEAEPPGAGERIQPVRPRRRDGSVSAARAGGAWLVVAVYVIAITALALAIYERFVA